MSQNFQRMTFRMTKFTKFFPIITVAAFLFFLTSFAQTSASYANSSTDSLSDHSIKSVQLHKSGNPLSEAIINLGTLYSLSLSFDDLLDGNVKNYQYKLLHCDHHWNPSEIYVADYISGFPVDQIIQYEYSVGTINPYIHYQLAFPTDNMQPTKSGNYKIQVFEDDPNDIVFEQKFKVIDEQVLIAAEIKPPLNNEDRRIKQEVSFSVLLNDLYVNNPSEEIKVVIKQNRRTDNQIIDLKPKAIRSNTLDYTYNNNALFEAGNEYRAFDTRTLKARAYNTQEIIQTTEDFQVVLHPDYSRNTNAYNYLEDLNGNYLIETYDGRNPETEGEYSWIKFTVPSKYLWDQELYIQAGFNDALLPLKYEAKKQLYSANIFLKQGYYNYQYLIKDKNLNTVSVIPFEGSFYETENEYSIYIYYQSFGDSYEQLIGFYSINSNQ